MADNVNLTAGDGTIVAGADVISSVAYPRVKANWGPDGTINDTDVASGKPFPVQLRGSDGTDRSNVLPVTVSSGTVTTVSTVTNLAQMGSNAINLGSGTGGSGTQRVIVDSSQLATLGSAASSASQPVVMASDQKFFANAYETVAASQTAQVLGGSGATGDYISHLLVTPANLNPGNVLLLDNATSITVFTGGTGSVTTLHPFTIDLRMVSASGAWKVTTGASVSVIGVGKFT